MLGSRTISRPLVIFALGLLCVLEPEARSVDLGPPAIRAASDSLNDGPHIYWQSDSSAVVFHLCADSLRVRTLAVSDTLRLHGLCADSLNLYAVSARAPEIQPHIFEHAPRIFAVSDIHGEYGALVNLLVNAEIVDASLHWRWGAGHLVVVGDVFDRGDMVSECLWLIYRLEREARRAGGRVHFLLGNHELMAMQGDLRYVNPKYTRGIARRSRVKYEDLYGPDMELGRWLRTKHTAIRLNGVIFVHGGIGPHVVDRGMTLAEINTRAREGIDLRSYELAFSDMPSFLYRSRGPFWYRGYHAANPGWYSQATPEEVQAILDHYGAEAIVVGHTEIDQVQGLYDGRVFGVDVPLHELGSFQGLLWEDGVFYRVTGSGEREPPVEPSQSAPSSP